MNVLDALDAASLRKDIPQFRAGDELKIHVRVIEGNKSRLQVFQGIVIRRQGDGVEGYGDGITSTPDLAPEVVAEVAAVEEVVSEANENIAVAEVPAEVVTSEVVETPAETLEETSEEAK